MHFATVWESIADAVPDHPAIVQGDRRISWAQMDDRAARLAAAFTQAGLGVGSKIGMYLYNCPEYIETNYAGFKVRATPVNVNYRYLDDELVYLLDNSDAEAIVFHSSLADRLARILPRLPRLRLLIEVDDGPSASGAVAIDGAQRYDDLLAAHEPAPRISRDERDIYMLYTGGTTGMPKGVMYEMGSFTAGYLREAPPLLGLAPITDPAEVAPAVRQIVAEGRSQVVMPGCPLMHGTGIWVGVMIPHLVGATVVLLEGRGLDVQEMWSTIEREGVTMVVIVGDAFARPMLRGLEVAKESGRPYDLSRLAIMTSTGAMFSLEVKEGMFDHIPHLFIIDVLGSTEGTMGMQFFTKDTLFATAKFNLGSGAKVFDESGNAIEPGSGDIGLVATTGVIPVGYFKDDEKSARTFRLIDGVRYSFPGDMATVEADGSITLLGRGSNVINTGGEKVYPEEVEEALKQDVAVWDALVFGVPDERFGERIEAVVSASPDTVVDPEGLIAATKGRIASYKVPRTIHVVEDVPRAPNGKADYKTAKRLAAERGGS
jgi:fatty-acyl-CoA synthase